MNSNLLQNNLSNEQPSTKEVKHFLTIDLPQTLDKCNDESKEIIINGHQECEQHILETFGMSDSCKMQFQKDMKTMMNNIQQRAGNFHNVYRSWINENVIQLANDACIESTVGNDHRIESKEIMQSLMIEQQHLKTMYEQKMIKLQNALRKKSQLENTLDYELPAIEDQLQSIKNDTQLKYSLERNGNNDNVLDMNGSLWQSLNSDANEVMQLAEKLIILKNAKEITKDNRWNGASVNDIDILQQRALQITTVFPS